MFPENGMGAVGSATAHIDDILGRAEPDLLKKVRRSWEQRLGKLQVQKKSSAHVGKEVARKEDCPAALTHGGLNEEPEVPSHASGAVGGPDGAVVAG